jgi:hypothetical protein
LKKKEVLTATRFNCGTERCIGDQPAQAIKEPGRSIICILLRWAASDDLATTFAGKPFNASNDRSSVKDKKLIRPFHNRSDSTLFRIAIAMSEAFGAKDVCVALAFALRLCGH